MTHPLDIFYAAKKFGDAPAVVIENQTYTFNQIAARCTAYANQLLRLPSSRPIAFDARADLSTLLLLYAAFSTNRIVVPLHGKSPRHEIDALCRHQQFVLLEKTRIEQWSFDVPPSSTTHTGFNCVSSRRSAPDGNNIMCILFTSGSEHFPKGVQLSRHAFQSSAAASEKNLGWRPGDKWLVNLPLHHVGGLSIITRCLIAGTCIIVMPDFCEESTLQQILHHHATMISLVPATLSRLMQQDTENLLERLRVILIGGAEVSPSLRAAYCQRKLNVFESYGMTESCSQVAATPQPVRNATEPPGLTPLQGVSIQILDDTRSLCAPMQVGRIALSGPMLMEGYLNSPPISKPFVTNDAGFLDTRHQLHVVGRIDDVIITGGEKVHPLEVEHALAAIRGVEAAVVFGVPDTIYGNKIAASLYVKIETFNPTEAARIIEKSFVSFKKPRLFFVAPITALPLLPNKKTNRIAAIRQATPHLSAELSKIS